MFGSLGLRRKAGGLIAAAALCESLSVHDGDSIRCGPERVRIANIDAPELPGSPKCEDCRRSCVWEVAAGQVRPPGSRSCASCRAAGC